MLWVVFVVLLILWLAGTAASYTLGGLIHLLLVAALFILMAQVITRQREPGVGTHELGSKDRQRKQPDDTRAA
jgi:uncharacterized protein (DUF58 family)